MASMMTVPFVFFFVFLFLSGLGRVHLLQVLEDDPIEVVEDWKELAVNDLKFLINNNSVAVYNLNDLLRNLMEFMSENPCIENEVARNVSEVMADGFTSVLEAMRDVKKNVHYLKLIKWRINFVKSLDIPTMNIERECPIPFFYLDEECVYVETKVKRSYRNARLSCNLMGGFLAEPNDMKQFGNYIHKITRQAEVFIGAVSPAMNGTWVWKTTSDVIADIPWDEENPDKDEPVGCMVAKGRYYRDIACTYRRIFACEIAL